MAVDGRHARDDEFTAFMTAAQPGLLRTARFLTGSDDGARELTQEALARTYAAWPRVQVDGALAYTRRIMVNHRRSSWRRWAREVPRPPGDARLDSVAVTDAEIGLRDEVVRLLAHLPQRQRAVVVLRYYVDLSEQEVADLMGISTGTVKSSAARGLAALRQVSATADRTQP
jgi:RNA polymerase sigma-70 factor (sigma-E family)